MQLTVIGTGYLGAVHAACMADLGHDVLGVDVDAAKIEKLAAGQTPFFEPGLPAVLARALASGNLRFSTSLAEAGAHGDVHFICVSTPQQAGSQAADMQFVDAVVDGLAPHLRPGALVVGKSTVPVGTAARIVSRIAELTRPGSGVEVAWNPEFLREGFAVHDTMTPDRLVVGVQSDRAERQLRAVYAVALEANTPWVKTDLTTAELVKVSANAFLATKISFINAMAEICEEIGGDVHTLAEALGHDARIGRRFLSAGLGFGGGCLPKDIRAFSARAKELGLGQSVAFLDAVDDINLRCRDRATSAARDLLGGTFTDRRVAVLGAAFKPNSDDVRDSPALHVARALIEAGADVRIHDPEATENARSILSAADYTTDVLKAVEGSDVVLHLTEWQDYRDLDPVALAGLAHTPRLLDARNALNVHRWRSAGWTVHTLGRPLV